MAYGGRGYLERSTNYRDFLLSIVQRKLIITEFVFECEVIYDLQSDYITCI